MKRIAIGILALLLAAPASADSLTKEELFTLYAKLVPKEVTAQRLQQLFDNLPAGAFKTTAATTLKQDLADAIQVRLDAINNQMVAPLESEQADVGDSEL